MAIAQLELRGLPGDGEIKPVHKYFATTGQHGDTQNQWAVVAAAIKREVRGELSRVYLRIMRALAVKHEVPFDVINDRDERFVIPADLQAIAEKITAGAMGQGERLSSAEERHLHARYIQLSAHWTPSKGLLINKPAKQRQIYRNSPQGGYPE